MTADVRVAAIDVGSQSVRAAVFGLDGHCLARATRPITIHRPAPDHAEQSSAEIWAAACASLREAMTIARCAPVQIASLAFDATSSVVLGRRDGVPLGISTTGEPRWDVVMWCDHRAVAEAAEIDATRHRALDFVGGRMSPEMVLPKLMWVKRRLPAAWQRADLALDLTDWMGWRATGRDAASNCALTCKWAHLAHEEPAWPADLLARIGLDDLLARTALPARGLPTAARLGPLSAAAAAELGLTTDCIVGVGVIDAQAGCLGSLASLEATRIDREIAVIGGTSTCHMAISRTPRPVPGVWGPYLGTLLPGLWLNEGGQSATGSLLEHVVASHSAARQFGPDPHARLWAEIESRSAREPDWLPHAIVVPDFNGNRSPLADPQARGLVWGLTLDASPDALVDLYAAAAIGAVLGTRHVIEAMDRAGWAIERLHLVGGHARSRGFAQLYADATGCEVALAEGEDGVLAGTAIIAATALAGTPDPADAARRFWRPTAVLAPSPGRADRLRRHYRAFRDLQAAGLAAGRLITS
ncbi:MAG: FGGY family pentulose kinase [Alphaproteobacteria bacterium]|nr:FGGY family pentulose kinase [Alphaproteobacteria bacterium]